jgi:hypothetical protein
MKTAPTPTLEGPGTRAFSDNLVCDMESGIEDADNNHLAPAYLGSISPASMRPFHAIIGMGSIFHLLCFSDGVLSLCLPRVPPFIRRI